MRQEKAAHSGAACGLMRQYERLDKGAPVGGDAIEIADSLLRKRYVQMNALSIALTWATWLGIGLFHVLSFLRNLKERLAPPRLDFPLRLESRFESRFPGREWAFKASPFHWMRFRSQYLDEVLFPVPARPLVVDVPGWRGGFVIGHILDPFSRSCGM